ncbi:VOC family protein [Luteimonas gilva]|uniref:VOC family protein n=1 Tax=Luteimonas gilva TaxID=2572684 RepID=A0A4U5JXD8_9GAMM|nr:VOC family protein [Luteimonas gilva]TKR33351.1 VOC family protein [Luteimonas gilva]
MAGRENRIDFIEFPAASETDVARASEFYRTVFGWRWQDWGDDYADTRDSGLGAGLNADPAHRPGAPLAVIYASRLEEARDKAIAAGGALIRDIFSFPGGRRFHFRDPAGNELAVWSDSET